MKRAWRLELLGSCKLFNIYGRYVLCIATCLLSACASTTLAPIPSGNNRIAINAVPIEVAAKEEPPTTLSGDDARTAVPPAAPQNTAVVVATTPNIVVPDTTGTSTGLEAVQAPVGFSVFAAGSGSSLRDSLEQYLQANGWRLSWRAEGTSPGRVRDFRLSEPVSLPVDSISGLLNQLLVGRGLHATISNKSKAVLIENDANALPRAKRED